MSDQEVKEKVSRKRKRNIISKMLRDQGDHKGAFSLKIINPKKGEYKREKININKLESDDEEGF